MLPRRRIFLGRKQIILILVSVHGAITVGAYLLLRHVGTCTTSPEEQVNRLAGLVALFVIPCIVSVIAILRLPKPADFANDWRGADPSQAKPMEVKRVEGDGEVEIEAVEVIWKDPKA